MLIIPLVYFSTFFHIYLQNGGSLQINNKSDKIKELGKAILGYNII